MNEQCSFKTNDYFGLKVVHIIEDIDISSQKTISVALKQNALIVN